MLRFYNLVFSFELINLLLFVFTCCINLLLADLLGVLLEFFRIVACIERYQFSDCVNNHNIHLL